MLKAWQHGPSQTGPEAPTLRTMVVKTLLAPWVSDEKLVLNFIADVVGVGLTYVYDLDDLQRVEDTNSLGLTVRLFVCICRWCMRLW